MLVWLAKRLSNWKRCLIIIQPETLTRWHRAGFKKFWAWKSRRRTGRPTIPLAVIKLIRKISNENRLWGAPRIHGELLKLGVEVSQGTVEKYMTQRGLPGSPSWKTFLASHARDIVAVDFLVVPTLRFQLLYVLVVLSHDRRRILHHAVTSSPCAEWTNQQIREAFSFQDLPKFIIHDRERSFSKLSELGVRDITIAPRSPWQNGYVERVIGSIKRECLENFIIFGPRHLRRVLSSYCEYYNDSRTHTSLNKDSPNSRTVHVNGKIISFLWWEGFTTGMKDEWLELLAATASLGTSSSNGRRWFWNVVRLAGSPLYVTYSEERLHKLLLALP